MKSLLVSPESHTGYEPGPRDDTAARAFTSQRPRVNGNAAPKGIRTFGTRDRLTFFRQPPEITTSERLLPAAQTLIVNLKNEPLCLNPCGIFVVN